MRKTAVILSLATLLGAASAAPAAAQNYKFDWTLYGGGSWYSTSLSADDGHFDAGGPDVKFTPGWQLGTQATYWWTPRIGTRANIGYAERPIAGSESFLPEEEENLAEDINLWDATLDLMWRFMNEPAEEFVGTETYPYIALGIGAKNINPAVNTDISKGGETATGVRFAVPNTRQSFVVLEEWGLQGLAGIGADVRFRPNMIFRAELGGRFWDSPMYQLTGPTTTAEEDVGSVIKQIYANLGFGWAFGLEPIERVVVTPPPAPPVEEPPPPPPTTRDITVCVVDPTVDNGIRVVNATYMIESRDTLVNGQPISSTVGPVMIATESDWYVAGQPMVLEVAGTRTEFVTYGGARVISADDLSYLGTIDGLPVYASRSDAMDVADQLADLRDAQAEDDLEEILEQEEELLTALDDVEVVYVPLQPVGCVFQGLQRVEEVVK